METDSVVEDVIRIAREWIDTPYIHQASVKGAGCDCLGLIRGVWREYSGRDIVPPTYSRDWAEANPDETMYDGIKKELEQIPIGEIEPGDVVLFRMFGKGPARHCAILAEHDGIITIIHARRNTRVREEEFTTFWRKRLAYAFRIPMKV